MAAGSYRTTQSARAPNPFSRRARPPLLSAPRKKSHPQSRDCNPPRQGQATDTKCRATSCPASRLPSSALSLLHACRHVGLSRVFGQLRLAPYSFLCRSHDNIRFRHPPPVRPSIVRLLPCRLCRARIQLCHKPLWGCAASSSAPSLPCANGSNFALHAW